MERSSYGKRGAIILAVLLAVGWLCGCGSLGKISLGPKLHASICAVV